MYMNILIFRFFSLQCSFLLCKLHVITGSSAHHTYLFHYSLSTSMN